MQTTATLRGVRLSAQKGRVVADAIRGLPVDRALNILAFSPKKGARIIKKVLESAIANAEHNEGADIDELKVTTIYVDKAATLKDWAGDPPCNVSSVSVTDAQSSSVTAEVGILTYKGTAVGTCGDQKLTPLWGGTVFFNEGGNWKATFMIEQPMS